jgi:hypothetical protein
MRGRTLDEAGILDKKRGMPMRGHQTPHLTIFLTFIRKLLIMLTLPVILLKYPYYIGITRGNPE